MAVGAIYEIKVVRSQSDTRITDKYKLASSKQLTRVEYIDLECFARET